MELLYVATTIVMLASPDERGAPQVDVYPSSFTTEENCIKWRESMYRMPPEEIDVVTGSKIIYSFYECTPYRPQDILDDIEQFRAAN